MVIREQTFADMFLQEVALAVYYNLDVHTWTNLLIAAYGHP
jgi:hypothetical protein